MSTATTVGASAQFEMPDEKDELRHVAREFLDRHLGIEVVRQFDEAGEFPLEIYRRIGELGWLGIPFAEEHGGSAGDALDEAVLLEEMGRVNGPLAAVFLVSTLVCGKAIRDLGTERQIATLVPGLIDGTVLFGLALTEPEAGSDVAGLATRATETADGFLLEGQKIFCTQATLATHLLVIARTGEAGTEKSGKFSMFIVPTDAARLEIVPIPKLGLHTTPSCMLYFDSVEVPRDGLLGARGGAWSHVMKGLNRERLAIGAMCTGMASAAMEYAIGYARERRQFGVPIISFEAVQQHLAEMVSEVEAARSLMLRAAQLEARGDGSTEAASMAKIRGSEACVRTARLGMQVLGGYGYTNEYPMQRYLRDSLIHPIAGGTNEIQRNIISGELVREWRNR